MHNVYDVRFGFFLFSFLLVNTSTSNTNRYVNKIKLDLKKAKSVFMRLRPVMLILFGNQSILNNFNFNVFNFFLILISKASHRISHTLNMAPKTLCNNRKPTLLVEPTLNNFHVEIRNSSGKKASNFLFMPTTDYQKYPKRREFPTRLIRQQVFIFSLFC